MQLQLTVVVCATLACLVGGSSRAECFPTSRQNEQAGGAAAGSPLSAQKQRQQSNSVLSHPPPDQHTAAAAAAAAACTAASASAPGVAAPTLLGRLVLRPLRQALEVRCRHALQRWVEGQRPQRLSTPGPQQPSACSLQLRPAARQHACTLCCSLLWSCTLLLLPSCNLCSSSQAPKRPAAAAYPPAAPPGCTHRSRSCQTRAA